MKNVNLVLDEYLLKDRRCREFITHTWNSCHSLGNIYFSLKKEFEEIDIGDDTKKKTGGDPKKMFDAFLFFEFISCMPDLLSRLIDEEVINVEDIYADKELSYVTILYSVKNINLLREIITQYDKYLTRESYGLKKQIKIINNSIKEKYIKLENNLIDFDFDSIKLDKLDLQYINPISTLFALEEQNLIKIDRLKIDLDISEQIGFDPYANEPVLAPLEHGSVVFNSKIIILQKLIDLWADYEGVSFKEISFNIADGTLFIGGKYIKLFSSNKTDNLTKISNIFNCLVKNINNIVSYEELATLSCDRNINFIRQKFSEKGNKTKINTQTKYFIKSIKEKLISNKLDDQFDIIWDKGFGLFYKERYIETDIFLKHLLEKNANLSLDP